MRTTSNLKIFEPNTQIGQTCSEITEDENGSKPSLVSCSLLIISTAICWLFATNAMVNFIHVNQVFFAEQVAFEFFAFGAFFFALGSICFRFAWN